MKKSTHVFEDFGGDWEVTVTVSLVKGDTIRKLGEIGTAIERINAAIDQFRVAAEEIERIEKAKAVVRENGMMQ